MNPYYEQDGITIYHGDCREVLPQVTGDVLICDPPYGFGLYATDRDIAGPVLGEALGRFLSAAIFGYPEWLVAQCMAWGRVPDEWVSWWPTNATCKGGLRSKPLPREQEAIAIFGACPGAAGVRRQRYGTLSAQRIGLNQQPNRSADARLGDVWTDAAPGLGFLSGLRVHPNEKPIVLMRRLVGLVSNSADVVVDPTAGSGTTLRAAKDLSRRAVGIEIEERYCEIAAKRLAQSVMFEAVA